MVSGAFGKTRFPFFLLAMAGGRSWDHDGSLMRPPPEDKEMIDHVKHGMYFRVIAWETVRDHLEHVKDLMRSNNADQGFAMGQHLIGRASKMHAHCCVAAPPTPGQSMWTLCGSKLWRRRKPIELKRWTRPDWLHWLTFICSGRTQQ